MVGHYQWKRRVSDEDQKYKRETNVNNENIAKRHSWCLRRKHAVLPTQVLKRHPTLLVGWLSGTTPCLKSRELVISIWLHCKLKTRRRRMVCLSSHLVVISSAIPQTSPEQLGLCYPRLLTYLAEWAMNIFILTRYFRTHGNLWKSG